MHLATGGISWQFVFEKFGLRGVDMESGLWSTDLKNPDYGEEISVS